MWIEEINGKYKYIERYKCPRTGKAKRVSVTLKSKTLQAQKEALLILEQKMNEVHESKMLLEVADEYYKYKSTFVKPITLIKSRRAFTKFLYFLGVKDIRLNEITPLLVQQAITKSVIEEKSFGYIKICFGEFRRVLEYAEKLELVENISFLHKIKIPRKTKTREQVLKSNSKYLDSRELKRVLKLLYEISPSVSMLCEFQALTGLRFGELVALRACDYDGEYIDVNGTITRYQGLPMERSTPKNVYSYRKIQLSDRAKEIWQYFEERGKALRAYNNAKDTEYIFITSRGLPYETRYLNRVLKKIDFDKPLSTHVFRHTHISLLAGANVPIKAIMDRVGHNEPRTTLSIYTHVNESMRDKTRAALTDIDKELSP